jgi:histidine triad (HIT) family protein
MVNLENCAFCRTLGLEWRTITFRTHYFSILSVPRFRPGHCLVIPRRHVTTISQLNSNERDGIMLEIGRLQDRLDNGGGSGLMQKFQPAQAENGIKMDHLHFHVFPRHEPETNLFPVPQPNNFKEGFKSVDRDTIVELLPYVRPS